MKAGTLVLCLLWGAMLQPVFAQQQDLFTRLRAISNNGTEFYNIDGIEISSQTLQTGFSKKEIQKKFKHYAIREKDLQVADSAINLNNYRLTKSEKLAEGVYQQTTYYFIERKPGVVTAISFSAINKTDRELEKEMVFLLLNDEIPASVFSSLATDSINFAGRMISLGGNCRWMGVNNLQCPYFGQLNWSLHRSLEDARQTIENHYLRIHRQPGGKIISEEQVSVRFEGTETMARKAVYDLKGVKSLLAGLTGGKTLTLYFVAAEVRHQFISCVMSYWNNDTINPSGLPPLLETVMKLN